MNSALPLAVCLTAGLAALILLRRPLRSAFRLTLRSAAGLGLIWLFNLVAAGLGMHIGFNLFTGVTVGLLGLPGFALLLLLQCI